MGESGVGTKNFKVPRGLLFQGNFPRIVLYSKLPFKILYQIGPHFDDNIKVFGCFCYASTLGAIGLFDLRVRMCIFLGFRCGFIG